MNKERIEIVAKVLDNLAIRDPRAFNMGMWLSQRIENECGTVACIAGWAVAKKVESEGEQLVRMGGGSFMTNKDCFVRSVPNVAQEWLGLDDDQAGELFHGSTAAGSGGARIGAACLRNLAATGVVDWHLATDTVAAEEVP